MKRITKFKDIPSFTRSGNYEVTYPIDALPKVIKEYQDEGLILEPDFQRGHVWIEAQQIAFLEFFFKGGTTGRVIYLNNPSWQSWDDNLNYNEFVCVDGLQRITAALKFMDNKLPVFGSLLSEFEDKLIGTHHAFRININDLKTRAEVLTWYLEMNSGGTPHSEKELTRVQALLDAEKKRKEKRGNI